MRLTQLGHSTLSARQPSIQVVLHFKHLVLVLRDCTNDGNCGHQVGVSGLLHKIMHGSQSVFDFMALV